MGLAAFYFCLSCFLHLRILLSCVFSSPLAWLLCCGLMGQSESVSLWWLSVRVYVVIICTRTTRALRHSVNSSQQITFGSTLYMHVVVLLIFSVLDIENASGSINLFIFTQWTLPIMLQNEWKLQYIVENQNLMVWIKFTAAVSQVPVQQPPPQTAL